MDLEAIEASAFTLKTLVRQLVRVDSLLRITVGSNALVLETLMSTHEVIVALKLDCQSFLKYEFHSSGFSGGVDPFSWSFDCFPSELYHLLSLANDDDRVRIHIYARSNRNHDRFSIQFIHPNRARPERYSVHIIRSAGTMLDSLLGRRVYAPTIQAGFPTDWFIPLVHHAIVTHERLNITITREGVHLRAGYRADSHNYNRDEDTSIMIVRGRISLSLQLALQDLDYFLPILRLAERVIVILGYPNMFPMLPPLMTFVVDQYSRFHVFMPFHSIVRPWYGWMLNYLTSYRDLSS